MAVSRAVVNKAAASACPCGTGVAYSRCCGPFHRSDGKPATAEALMRSRYSAFAKRLPGYLLATWHPDTRPHELSLDPQQRWIGLEIVEVTAGGSDDDVGTVSFDASYELGGRPGTLREVSSFERIDGHWLYRSGRIAT